MTLAGMGAHDFSACGDLKRLAARDVFSVSFLASSNSRHYTNPLCVLTGSPAYRIPAHYNLLAWGAAVLRPTKKILCRLRGLLRTWFCCWRALFGGQQCDQDVAFHARHGFDLAVFADSPSKRVILARRHFLGAPFRGRDEKSLARTL